jgi:hypothetical protein
MPAVIDTPELLEYVEIHNLHIEKPRTRQARPGFWRTLVHRMAQHLTRTPHASQAPSCSVHRPFETPMDRVTREYL